MGITDEIRQVGINLSNRIRKLEVQQVQKPISLERAPYLDSVALTTTSGTPVDGADLILEPGVYLVHGHFDFDAGVSGGGLTDEAQIGTGQLVVNSTVMPGAASMKLLSVLGSDGATRRGLRATVSDSWVLSLWDYRQIILQDSPAMFFRFDDGGIKSSTVLSRVRDRSPNGVSGTYSGGTRLLPGPLKLGLDNVPSYALLLNGTTQYVQSGIFSVSTVSGTLDIWFKTSASGAIQPILCSANLGTHRSGSALYIDATGHLVLEVDSAGASQTLTSVATYNDGLWHHAMGTFDATTLRLFADGAQVNSVAQTVTPVASTMFIGRDNGTLFFNGYVAEAVYFSAVALRPNRALLQYQIGAAAATYLPTTYYKADVLLDNPLRFYRIDEPSGTSMLDASTSNVIGTYTNVSLNQPGGIMVDPDGLYHTSGKFDGFYGGSSTASGADTGLPSGAAARTIEAWIYVTEIPALVPPSLGVVAGYGTAGVANQAFYLCVTPFLNLRFANDSATLTGATVLVLRRWYHVAVETDGAGNVNLYLDGDLEATGALTINTVLSGLFYIGNFGAANRAFVGLIDEVSVMATALGATREASRFRTGRSNRAFVSLGAYKTGGTDVSYVRTGGTKLIATKLQGLTKS